MNSIEYIHSLSPEEKAKEMKALKRAVAKNILTFAAIKAAIAFAIIYAGKKARELD